MHRRFVGPLLLLVAAATAAQAVDVPVTGLKLIVVDKGLVGAKAVFVAKDPGITKGTDTDPGSIFAELGIAYDSTGGVFAMPPGPGWLVNKESVAKYVNKVAPSGGAVKVSVIKPSTLVKVVGKSLGDTPIDISLPPSGDVFVSHHVVNGGTSIRHCTRFGSCSHKSIAGGAGYKLVCKGDSFGDPGCLGAPPPACCGFVDPDPICGWTPSALTCAAVGGTPGGAGSTCDSASGTCTSVAAAGGCCDGLPTPFGDLCLAGPTVTAGTCSGIFAPAAVCTPSGSCL